MYHSRHVRSTNRLILSGILDQTNNIERTISIDFKIGPFYQNETKSIANISKGFPNANVSLVPSLTVVMIVRLSIYHKITA